MSSIRIQAEITGYQGVAANLLGALDTDSGLFIVAKELASGDRMDEAIVASNDPRSERRDSLFTEEYLQEAIRLFFRNQSTGMIELMPSMSKHDPAHRIENHGIDEGGTKYRLSPDITNGNVAVLAMVWMANRTYLAQSATDFSTEMADMFLSI